MTIEAMVVCLVLALLYLDSHFDRPSRKEFEKLKETIMSGLTDLQAVVAKLQADLTGLQTSVQNALIAIENEDQDTAVETAAQALQAVDAGLEAATASLSAIAPAPAPAAPAAPTPAAS